MGFYFHKFTYFVVDEIRKENEIRKGDGNDWKKRNSQYNKNNTNKIDLNDKNATLRHTYNTINQAK